MEVIVVIGATQMIAVIGVGYVICASIFEFVRDILSGEYPVNAAAMLGPQTMTQREQ